MKRYRVVTITGTRPETIKMTSVAQQINPREAIFDRRVVTTAQRSEMLHQVLAMFDLEPCADLGLFQI